MRRSRRTASSLRARQLIAIFLLGGMVGFYNRASAGSEPCPEGAATVVSIEGTVEALPAGETRWRSVALNDTYCPGDQIRTMERSRTALQLRNETLIRLDQNTVVRFTVVEPESPSLLKLLSGKAFFMTRFPRPLTIETPYVNASSGGTEYVIEVDKTHETSTITVIEGKMHLRNAAGNLTVSNGESSITHAGEVPALSIVVSPKDALRWALYYPPVLNLRDLRMGTIEVPADTDWRAMVAKSIAAYDAGDSEMAFSALAGAPAKIEDPRFYAYRASLLLSVGRVDEAQSDIEQSLTLSPRNGLALALQSLIAVVQNHPERALHLAREASSTEPESVSVRIALSYAWQANFNLPEALTAAQDATRLDPNATLAWARSAELWMSQGYLTEALEAAKRAEALNPREVRIQTILGFAYLTQINVTQARESFERAISLNSADPLPRLGLGLANIRSGDLLDGRKDLEIAAALDPGNALIRSYLGKAYYEENRDPKAAVQFDLAEQLDPKDPTPYLYDAIRMQTINRPVEALQDLQKSIELNDNRSPYRSRLQLDEDLATRSVSQGRIYTDLGFGQAALVEAWKSVNIDPSNYSAQRFLADSYANLPHSDIARLSSLLVSQLLQPVNNNPIQPHLGESIQLLSPSAGPANSSFNEYSRLFTQDGIRLLASGIAGGNDTKGEEVIANGQYQRYSYSVGQSRYLTDGYRPNADLSETNYDLFAQTALTYKSSVQMEVRGNHSESGDLDLRFDPNDYLPDLRREVNSETYRIGLHHQFNPRSTVIVNAFHRNRAENVGVPTLLFVDDMTSRASGAEAENLYRGKTINTIVGVGHYEGKDLENGSLFGFPVNDESNNRYTNLYAYSMIGLLRHMVATLAVSGDSIKSPHRDRDQINPKLGLMWDVTPSTTLRMAGFRAIRRPLVSDQTIEPVQVAGFQQFFDDVNATDYKRYGVGIDQKISSTLLWGMEISKRDLNIPYELGGVPLQTDDAEHQGRAYLAWAPYRWMAAHADYLYERQDPEDVSLSVTPKLTTQRVPVGVNLYLAGGLFSKLTATYMDQKITSFNTALLSIAYGADQFWLADAVIGYRLPNRLGIVTLEADNIFNRKFQFQDVVNRYPSVVPERVMFARVTFSF